MHIHKPNNRAIIKPSLINNITVHSYSVLFSFSWPLGTQFSKAHCAIDVFCGKWMGEENASYDPLSSAFPKGPLCKVEGTALGQLIF